MQSTKAGRNNPISGQPVKILVICFVKAMATNPSPPPEHATPPPIIAVLTVILLVFFFLGFFSVYFCRCFLQNLNNTWHIQRTPSGNIIRSADASATTTGLDPSLIQSFPTFEYSTVKDFRKEKYGLECAICLLEFENDSLLRLLTVCYHVFHQECIDLWLESHKTCPVCRRDLDLPPDDSLEKFKELINRNNSMHDSHDDRNEALEDDVRIDIIGEENVVGSVACGRATHDEDGSKKQLQSVEDKKVERFSRSHTTGHSIVRTRDREEQDRYTLRLPDHVKVRLIRGPNCAKSCSTFGEFSNYTAADK
jgi:hypothetical protein